MKRKIFLSAGHQGDVDPGAIANGVHEADLTIELRDLIAAAFKSEYKIEFEVDNDSEDLKGTMQHVSEVLSDRDIAIDIHFNAGDPRAFGTEVFIPDNYSTFEYVCANQLCKTICTVLQTYNRGVKTESQSSHKRLGFMRPNCMNILIEVCFITNTSDLFKYQHNKQTLAITLAKAINDLSLVA